MFDVSILPSVNAVLNGLAAVLLVAAYGAIRRRRIPLHKGLMLSAVAVSALFLVSYLVYHAIRLHTEFQGEGWVRGFYYTLLISHVILAITIVLLVPLTLYRALKGDFARHRRIARWTLPIWLYVSVTGVIVYLMLYVMFDG